MADELAQRRAGGEVAKTGATGGAGSLRNGSYRCASRDGTFDPGE